MGQALSGVRVIDVTSALSGPYCTMLLGDLGAEVIKLRKQRKGIPLEKVVRS